MQASDFSATASFVRHRRLGACLTLALGLIASVGQAEADTITIQLGAATITSAYPGMGQPEPLDTISEPGALLQLDLTPGVAVTQTFYTAKYVSTCTNCSSFADDLRADVTVSDLSLSGTGSDQFDQVFLDFISGDHAFQAFETFPSSVLLSNGLSLTLTPHASPSINVRVGTSASQAISATFLLTGSPVAVSATPEPSSIALLGTGLLGVGGALRKRIA